MREVLRHDTEGETGGLGVPDLQDLLQARKCAGKGSKAFGMTVPKSLICPGCIIFTHEKKLSPHNMLFCASKHPTYAKPVKSDVYKTLQKYFDSRLGREVTAELWPGREQGRFRIYLFNPVGTCWMDSMVGRITAFFLVRCHLHCSHHLGTHIVQ